MLLQMAEKKGSKNSAAVSLGRRGGKKRAEALTPEQRSAIAKKAAEARWKKAAKPKPKAAGA